MLILRFFGGRQLNARIGIVSHAVLTVARIRRARPNNRLLPDQTRGSPDGARSLPALFFRTRPDMMSFVARRV